MKNYTVKYVNKIGDYQEFIAVSADVQQAIETVFELCPDCRRVIHVKPTAMLKD